MQLSQIADLALLVTTGVLLLFAGVLIYLNRGDEWDEDDEEMF